MGTYTLGHLIFDLQMSEQCWDHNSKIAAQHHPAMKRFWDNQAAAQLFQPDPERMPGIEQIQTLCDELGGLTAANVRKIRGVLCRLRQVPTQELDGYALTAVADAMMTAPKQIEG